MKLSVIVPCYNNAGTLRDQLEALARQTSPPWEVIIADNGSRDASRAIGRDFESRLPGLRIVDASGRRGAAHARNVGAAASTGDALAFCDADDITDPGWAAALLEALAVHPFVASRFSLIANTSHKPHHAQEIGLQQSEYALLPHAGGSGLAIHRSLHEAVGGFDPSMRYHEDTDYCWRVQRSGTPLTFAERAVVHVRQKATTCAVFRQKWNWAVWEVKLYRRYRSTVMAPDHRGAVAEWLRLPQMLWQAARGRRSRRLVVSRLALRLGRLYGCILYLTLLL